MRAPLLGMVVLLGSVALGCGPKPGSAPRPDPVPVRVTNRNRADVVVSLVQSPGTVMRLGTVVTGQTQVLTIRGVPVARLQGVQFELHLIGTEGTVRTRPVSPGPGQMVVLRIEDLLSTSQISIAEDGGAGPRLP